ncbi:CBS domain-containing protein [Comamonas flocculans]|uniref:CBS domain-containing protein n=1 Tax=Comamonas flocculans TaxID=2597701 RepID=A0A5B8RV53_9BURK|nr:CBS domain-containing protein [Comamonas flocculans]QEA13401.1 CBS domain-containing protein [Comamonas flocculans]
MFFVFGPTGRVLRGDADAVSRFGLVKRVGRPQALRTRVGQEQAPAFSAGEAAAREGPASRPAPILAYEETAAGPGAQRRVLRHVSDVMTRGAITVSPGARVNDAWQTMAQHGVAQAPVVDEQGQLLGLLLRADMAPLDLLPEPGAIEQAIALARRPVAQVMLSPVPAVSPDTDLRRVARVFLDTGLPGLPVTDEAGHCTGFISRTDILQALVADPPLDLWG